MAKETYESPQMGAFMRRIIRAMVRRAGDADHEALVELVKTRRELDAAIGDAARALHANDYSWTFIGNELGITRQAARQMYATKRKADQ